MKTKGKLILATVFTFAMAISFATSALAGSPLKSLKSKSCPDFKPGTLCSAPSEPDCGDDCDNKPFCATDCWTTESGPAWSGATLSSQTNLLYCANATYANCHVAGPPWATGISSDNIPLPCKLSPDGKMADCKCQVFVGPSYVNMYGIMNLGVFYETVAVCGADGSKCQNITTCTSDGSGKCLGKVPPVCKYVAQQNAKDPENSLIPGADLISTFGFGFQDNYTSGSTSCNGRYAGCMTAPCKFIDDESAPDAGPRYAQCSCPVWHGDYTISQYGQSCDPGKGYVWE